jgi:YVTN family beta-propeller protein
VISGTTNQVVATIPLGSPLGGATFDSANGDVYVTNWGSDKVGGKNVSVISGTTNQVVATVFVGGSPVGAAFDSANGDIYVTIDGTYNLVSHNVSVISGSTNRVVASIPVGGINPFGVTFDSVNGDVYVTNYGSNSVSVISGTTNQVVATVPVGSSPESAVFDSANGDIYITNMGSNNVTVISDSTNTVVATIPLNAIVETSPQGAAYDSANGDIYVTNQPEIGNGGGNVSVISGSTNKIVATLGVGENPSAAAFDPKNDDVYVADSFTGAISIIGQINSGITTTLTSVWIGPSTESISEGYNATFTAFPSCSSNPCPSVVVYSWSLSAQLATLWQATGSTVELTAGNTAGTVTLFVNATLNGITKEGSAITTIVPILASVDVGANPPSITIGSSSTLTVTINCRGGICPTGVIYSWSTVPTGLGNLSSVTGASTTFTASSKTGTATLTVSITLGTVTKWANATITITAKPSSTVFLGLSGNTGYILIGVIAALVVAIALLLLRGRGKRSATPGPEKGKGEKEGGTFTDNEKEDAISEAEMAEKK